MKPSELNKILREVVAEELAKESYIGHPDWDEEHGDGYTNDYQRAFAHSQATQPRPQDEKKKAEELAKKGKFVVISNNDIHCKFTDAVLGSCIGIEGVFDTYEEAEKKANEIGVYMDGVGVVTPEFVKSKENPSAVTNAPSSKDDDVPFQEGNIDEGKRICAWCKKDMGPAPTEKDTHGICPECAEKMKSDIAASNPKNPVVKEVNYTKTSTGQDVIAQGAPGSVVRFASENPDLIKQMREWAKDCQWKEDPEEIDEMSDEEILKGVQRHYDGGIKQFISDSHSSAGVPIGYKEGYGMGDMSKDPKKAFKGARWTVKFNEGTDPKSKINVLGGAVTLGGDVVPAKNALGGGKSRCKCGGELKYSAEIGAPGTGQSWECAKCKKGYVKLGNQFIDPQDIDPTEPPPWELDPSDVMENKVTMNELKSIIKDLISEMWVGWEEKKELNESDRWNPQPLPKTKEEIEKLIFSLKEGGGIGFFQDAEGRSGNWEAVEKTSDGVDYIYKQVGNSSFGSDSYPYLETDEEVSKYAADVATKGRYQFYNYYPIESYTKHRHRDYHDDDQQVGDYEKYGPDPIRWQDVTEDAKYEKWIDDYVGEKCPKCGMVSKAGEGKVLNPSNPTVHQCKCGHKWNPDNEKSTLTREDTWPSPDMILQQYTSVDKWAKDNVDNHKKYIGEPLKNYGFPFARGDTISTESDIPTSFDLVNGMKLWNMAKKKQQDNIKLGKPIGWPGFPNESAKPLYEAKGMNSKDKLRFIVKESVQEVLKEYSEKEELQIIKSIASIARTANSRISGLQPEEVQRAFREVDRLAAILVKMHDDATGYDVPVKGQEKTALGVTQETISRTKNVLEQMLFQRRKK